MTFLTHLSSFMSHVGQYCSTTFTAFGSTTITTITSTRCFVFTGDLLREQNQLQFTSQIDYSILLPSSLSSIISRGDVVKSVVDGNSRVVVAAGKLEEYREYEHWSDGLQFFVGGLTRIVS